MRKKLVVRMLCLAMAASMIGTMVPTSLYPVVAHAETAGQEASTAKAVLEDGSQGQMDTGQSHGI